MEILYFSSPTCISCGMVGKYLEDYSNLKVIKIDVLEQRDIAISNDVLSVPTLILKENDIEIKRHIGFINKSDLNTFIGE